MEEKKENILGTEKISKLLVKFAIPAIISMVVNALYNIVDQVFIGQGVGYLGNGATTVVFPLTCFAMSFAMLFGDGAASFMSLKLGQKDEEGARRGTAAGILSLVLSGIIIAVAYLIFMEPFCRLFGATEAILPYALDYGIIITIGIPFCAICAGGASIIRADGRPLFNMIGLLVGCFLNLVLDPIFIFVFHWGVKGAALATIIGQIANALLNTWYFAFRMKSFHITKSDWAAAFGYIGRISKLGVSSFITQISLVLAMAARNNVLITYGAQSKYGSEIPITTLGITMKVFNIIMCIVFGLAGGSQPIFGYNYGSGDYKRVKKTYRTVVSIATIISMVAFLAAQIFPLQIISIFGNESDLYNEFAVKCMRIYLLGIPIFGVQVVTGVFFQALGYPIQSSLVSLSKQVLFSIPATLILPIWMGVEGCLWAGPVSDVFAIILTLSLLLIYWKKIFSSKAKV